MKQIERIGLIDRIGRELQSRMTYSGITAYLRGFGVDTSAKTSGVNSKWVYVKDLLADSSPDLVLRIADELEIPHKYTITPQRQVNESSFWEANHFRLFISHLATFKRTVGLLQSSLKRFGISAFVAHLDIEPAKEWQDEIEAALFSMDALAAVLMPGFKESNWTDQEVGVAFGRDVLVIPLIRGLDPYGFIGKYQGLHSGSLRVSQVAEGLFRILAQSEQTRARMLSCLVATIVGSPTEQGALDKLGHLSQVPNLPLSYVEQLRNSVADSSLAESSVFRARVNVLLRAHGLQPLEEREAASLGAVDDEIPF